MQILSKYHLSAANDIPISNLKGWKPVTRASFVNAIKQNQSLFVNIFTEVGKPIERAEAILLKADQALSNLIKEAQADDEYRTVEQIGSNKIVFTNGSRLIFNQNTEYSFILAKSFNGGTCYFLWEIYAGRAEGTYNFMATLYYV